MCATSTIKKPPKVNNRPKGENSPNLVTLSRTTTTSFCFVLCAVAFVGRFYTPALHFLQVGNFCSLTFASVLGERTLFCRADKLIGEFRV
jgi:O-antigen/teichoic acid export membrane protein